MKFEEKRQKVLDILASLEKEGIWELAGPLQVFVKEVVKINEELLDTILNLIDSAIEKTNNEIEKDSLNKTKDRMSQIRENEKIERDKETEEADNLLDTI